MIDTDPDSRVGKGPQFDQVRHPGLAHALIPEDIPVVDYAPGGRERLPLRSSHRLLSTKPCVARWMFSALAFDGS
jgi:hypothetical protein